MLKPLIEMQGIVKKFPGVTANDQVDLTVYPGEIHALLGENGSGKSTLMSVLAGLYTPDAGSIKVAGEQKSFASPREAIANGIGMIHQHFKLVDTFTVAENIAMGDRNSSFLLSVEKIQQDIAEFGNKYGLEIDPSHFVWQLSVGEKQRVEILRMLHYGSKVLILDEPTAVLTPQECWELFNNLRKVAADGCAVILITHKLNEVMEIADRVTVLRGGRVTGTLERGRFNTQEMVRLMVGRDVVSSYGRFKTAYDQIALEIDKVSAFNNMGRYGLRQLSLAVKQGEILGLAGVAGNGQKELAEVITGLRKTAGGKVRIFGEDVTNLKPAEMIARGVSYVPEDRLGMGLVPDLNAMENLLLKNYQQPEYSGRWLLKKRAIEDKAIELVHKYQVKLASIYQPVKALSGGNLQKMLLAREISDSPKVMVVVYPARGLDIGATEAVHKLLLELKASGTAILLISEDLDEIMKLSDRVGVVFNGQIAGQFPVDQADLEEIGLLMAGAALAKGELRCGS